MSWKYSSFCLRNRNWSFCLIDAKNFFLQIKKTYNFNFYFLLSGYLSILYIFFKTHFTLISFFFKKKKVRDGEKNHMWHISLTRFQKREVLSVGFKLFLLKNCFRDNNSILETLVTCLAWNVIFVKKKITIYRSMDRREISIRVRTSFRSFYHRSSLW